MVKLPVCIFLVLQTVDGIVVPPPSSEFLIPTVDYLLTRTRFRIRTDQSASEINKMEKVRTSVDSFPVYKELFGKFALLALLAILLELVFNWFIIRRFV